MDLEIKLFPPKKPGLVNSLKRFLREALAILLWAYILLKVFVFDVDIVLLQWVAPDLLWILSFKVVVFFFVGSLVLVGLRYAPGSTFLVLFYPFWRVPKIVVTHWPLFIAATPAIYRFIRTLRTTVCVYCVGIASMLVITLLSARECIIPSMLALFGFLTIHVWRTLKIAYDDGGVLVKAANLIRKFGDDIRAGVMDGKQARTVKEPGSSGAASLYFLKWGTEFIDEKVREIARRRHYDIYLVLGWLYTVFLCIVVFGFEYFALSKIDSSAYKFPGEISSWSFFLLSFSVFSRATVASTIVPVSTLAILLHQVESLVFCSFILFILAFTNFRAARERFTDDVQTLGAELKRVAAAAEQRLVSVHQMNIEEAEIYLISDKQSVLIVNQMRSWRGLPILIHQEGGESSQKDLCDQSSPNPQRDSH